MYLIYTFVNFLFRDFVCKCGKLNIIKAFEFSGVCKIITQKVDGTENRVHNLGMKKQKWQPVEIGLPEWGVTVIGYAAATGHIGTASVPTPISKRIIFHDFYDWPVTHWVNLVIPELPEAK